MGLMIDPKIENLRTLGRAAAYVEILGGRKPCTRTVKRWCSKGVKRITLESVWIGGTIYTSEQALLRFFSAVSAARNRRPSSTSPLADDLHVDHELRARGLLPANVNPE